MTRNLVLFRLLAAAAQAQQTSITGKIVDSGGSIAAAKVTTAPKNGGPTQSSLTNPSGLFGSNAPNPSNATAIDLARLSALAGDLDTPGRALTIHKSPEILQALNQAEAHAKL